MAELYKLENEIKHYAWGSPELLPALTGKRNASGKPWAELWMGIHPGGPSKTTIQNKTVMLSDLTELPFLFKFLAAGSPLSIQAHPNLAQAREGFERENKEGIPLSAANRNYRDPNHKPEIVCALTPFTAMAGFREKAETAGLLSMVNGAESLCASLEKGYRHFLETLFDLNGAERKSLTASALSAADSGHPLLRLCGELARIYPADPGIISPLYLNVIELKPCEGLFLPAGILHAYVSGLAMECMANSDNVLRGGLTPKHIDRKELFSIVSFDPYKPELLKPREVSPGCFSYTHTASGSDLQSSSLCREFSLYLVKNPVSSAEPALPGGVEIKMPEKGIAAVYNGRAEITVFQSGTEGNTAVKKTMILDKGESAFISRRDPEERLVFSGDFTLFAALAPE